MTTKTSDEPVGAQRHYASHDIEPIEAIECWARTWPSEKAPHLAQAVKYISRCFLKHPEHWQKDVRKASWFLLRLLGEEWRLDVTRPADGAIDVVVPKSPMDSEQMLESVREGLRKLDRNYGAE